MDSADRASKQPAPEHDWWCELHLQAFLSLTIADLKIERRELVWVKRFFVANGHPDYYERFRRIIEQKQQSAFDEQSFDALAAIARQRMGDGDRRRFVNNLAQMCKAKGSISAEEYEDILEVAERIGMEDTLADSIIASVFSINDTFLAIIGLLALGAILYLMRVVLVPLVIAIFVAMIINRVEAPLARRLRLQRWRWLSKLATMLLLFSALSSVLLAAAESATEFADKLPYYQEKLWSTIAELNALSERFGVVWPGEAVIAEQLAQIPIGSTLQDVLGSIVNLSGNFLLVVVFTGFLVFSTDRLSGLGQDFTDKITAYVTIKTMMSVLTAVLALILCLSFGIDFALFWATVIFLLNYVPAVGAIIATLPPVLLAAIQLDSWSAVFVFAGLFTVLHVFIGQVLEPKLMGDRLSVNPIAILLGLIFWGFLWGIPGMFLAAPLMALLRVYSSYYNFSRPLERLLSAD